MNIYHVIKKFESFGIQSTSDLVKEIYPIWKSIMDMYPDIHKYKSDIRYPETQSIYISGVPVSTPKSRSPCGWGR